MVNNSTHNTLDETVKTTLDTFEAPFEDADWARMESMLDAAPKSSTFKWSYALVEVSGLDFMLVIRA